MMDAAPPMRDSSPAASCGSAFDKVMKRAREAARRAGMKRSDVASAIASVRSR